MSRTDHKSAWGVGLAIIYGGFVLFILSLVLFASIQDVQLVEPGYYEQGLDYQDRINRIRRTLQWEPPLTIEYHDADHELVLTLPPAGRVGRMQGEVRLVRPSNARLDRSRPLSLDQDGRQAIATDDLARGQWLIEVDWNIDAIDYYYEARIVIPPRN